MHSLPARLLIMDKAVKTRNAVVVVARARKAGAMRDRRKRRLQDRLRKELAAY